MILLAPSEITEEYVPISPNERKVKLTPAIREAVHINLYAFLPVSMWQAIIDLEQVTTPTVDQQTLYEYFGTYIKEWCIYRAYINLIQTKDAQTTPGGERTFTEQFSVIAPDNSFASKLAYYERVLETVALKLTNQLTKDLYTIASTQYQQINECTEPVEETRSRVRFIKPRDRYTEGGRREWKGDGYHGR